MPYGLPELGQVRPLYPAAPASPSASFNRALIQALANPAHTRPVQSVGEGVARAAQLGLTGYFAGQAARKEEDRIQGERKSVADTMAEALMTLQGGREQQPPGGYQPDFSGPAAGYSYEPQPAQKPGDFGAAARVLAGNPLTADQAFKLQLYAAALEGKKLEDLRKPPTVQSFFDDQGRETRRSWNPDTRSWDQQGGAKAAPAPQVSEFYSDTGQPYKAAWDPETQSWKQIGGAGFARNQPELIDLQAQLARLPASHPDRSAIEARIRSLSEGRAGGNLTIAQQRANEEISMAREWLRSSGLSRDEILRRSQQFTATGRENDAYDPYLGKLVNSARRRMYGDDAEHATFLDTIHGGAPGASPASPRRGSLPRLPGGSIDPSQLRMGETYDIGGAPYRWNGTGFDLVN